MRVLLRVLSPLLGLVVAAGGAVLAAEVIAAWVRSTGPDYTGLLVPWPAWRDGLMELSWRSVLVMIGCGVLALIGLLLLLVAATAVRRDIRLDDPAADVSVTTTPRVLARLVGQQVRTTEDVAIASVTASARTVKVVAIGHGEPAPGLRQTVAERAGSLLDDLPLAHRPTLSVAVRSDGGPR